MAGSKIKGINIKIGADTTGLDKALSGIEGKSKTVRNELVEVNRSLNKNKDSVVLWEQKQQLLSKAFETSKEKLNMLESAQEQVNKQFRNKKITDEQYRAFQREVENAKNEVNRFGGQLEEAESKIKDLKDDSDKAAEGVKNFGNESQKAESKIDDLKDTADKTSDSAENLGDELQEAGEQAENASSGGFTVMKGVLSELVADGIQKAAGALKDFTKDVVETGMTFESYMSNVGAISGVSAAELEQLTEKAKEMGATTKFTSAEAADAFSYMAMAGWKTEDMLSGIDGILQLAASSGEELGTTSDIVTDALTAFGLTAGDSAHFADVLAAASSNANTNVSMMGETFKYVAPVAGALNISIEDTAEAIGLLANSGIKSSQAGTTLRSILTRLSTDAGASKESLGALGVLTEELGVDFYDSEGKVRNVKKYFIHAPAWNGGPFQDLPGGAILSCSRRHRKYSGLPECR